MMNRIKRNPAEARPLKQSNFTMMSSCSQTEVIQNV